MLNNKGQSLILFVIVLPILLLIVVLVIDVGKAITLKQELDNINNIMLDYGLDHLEDDGLNSELTNIAKLNNNNIDEINIKLEDDRLYIELSTKIDVMFFKLIDISIFDINSYYVGYMEDDNKRIERVSE